MKLLLGVSLNRQSGAKEWAHVSTRPCYAKPQRMSVPGACAAPSCTTITTIRLTQRLVCAFSEQSTAWCCKKEPQTWLPVIRRQAATAIVMSSGPLFKPLCDNIQHCYESWCVTPYKPMKWVAARLC